MIFSLFLSLSFFLNQKRATLKVNFEPSRFNTSQSTYYCQPLCRVISRAIGAIDADFWGSINALQHLGVGLSLFYLSTRTCHRLEMFKTEMSLGTSPTGVAKSSWLITKKQQENKRKILFDQLSSTRKVLKLNETW